jgi:TetR/AcrR family transcriptional repressor of nem operon
MSKAAETRLTILQKAFDLIYKNGYQATSIDVIIATTRVTKGAFYYHFKTKDEMGLAMIREVMYPGMYDSLVKPLLDAEDPVQELYGMMKDLLTTNPFFDSRYGCPAINLIDEMSPVNESFNLALSALVGQWQDAIQKCIVKGKSLGLVRQEVNPKQVSYFVTAGYGGIRNIGKMYGSSSYSIYLKELKNYLKSLA